MTKNILIPIDFRVESLNTLKLALDENQGHEITAVLMFGGLPGNSFTDLLFFSPRDVIRSMSHPEFDQALAVLKNRYENVLKSLSLRILQSNHLTALDGLLKSVATAEVYIPKTYTLAQSINSFDPVPLLRKCNLPVYEMDWKLTGNIQKTNQLDALFNSYQNN